MEESQLSPGASLANKLAFSLNSQLGEKWLTSQQGNDLLYRCIDTHNDALGQLLFGSKDPNPQPIRL